MSQPRPVSRYALAVLGIVLLMPVFLTVFLVNAGDLTPPPGAPSPTMKTLDEVEARIPVQSLSGDASTVYLIDQPGAYYLTGNITGEAGKSGIQIAADQVTLDLNGFALVGVTGSVMGVENIAFGEALVIRNGALRDWGFYGVYLNNTPNCRLEGLSVSDCGQSGIHLTGNNGSVHECHVYGCGGHGIAVEHATVSSCVVYGNGDIGINGEASTITGCNAWTNDIGINASGSAVVNCNVHQSLTAGIAVEHCTVTGCTVMATESDTGFGMGIMASYSTVARCLSNSNESHGFEVLHSTVMACTSVSNEDAGIRATQSVVAGCNASANVNGIVSYGSSLIKDNMCDSNSDAGFRGWGGGTRFDGNNATGNDGGFVIDTGDLIVRNSADGNTTVSYGVNGNDGLGTVTSDPTTAGAWDNFE